MGREDNEAKEHRFATDGPNFVVFLSYPRRPRAQLAPHCTSMAMKEHAHIFAAYIGAEKDPLFFTTSLHL